MVNRKIGSYEGHEKVNWEQGYAFLLTGKMGLDFFGLGFRNGKVNWDWG